jgi:hypothetical protein
MDRQLRKAQGAERMNVMYAISKVLRLAKKELKGKSKYGEWGVTQQAQAGVPVIWRGVCLWWNSSS